MGDLARWGNERKKLQTSLSTEAIEAENIPLEATGTSPSLLPYPAGLEEEEKEKSFKMFQSMKD